MKDSDNNRHKKKTPSRAAQLFDRMKDRLFLAPLALLVAAVIFFPLKGVDPSPDSCWYLSNAVRMYNDMCPETVIIFRPVFPLMISIAFHFLGCSVENAMTVVRLFFAGNILISYYIGAGLFNKATGLAFSLLVFTSFVINRWSSYLLLDNIVPFFILLYIFLTYLAMERSLIKYFVLAGLSLGVSCLLKGVIAFLYLPLPVCLLIIKKYRTPRNVLCLSLVFVSAAAVLSPWLFKIATGDEAPEIVMGALARFDFISDSDVLPSANSSVPLSETIEKEAKALAAFFYNYIYRKFRLSILMLMGAVYTFYRALFRKHIPDMVIFISVVLFSPIAYAIAKTNFRAGQLLLLYSLLYLMTANFLINFPPALSSRLGERLLDPALKRRLLRAIQIVLVALMVLTQVFWGVNRRRNLYALMANNSIKNIYEFSFWKGDFTQGRWADETVREASKWIKENIPSNANVLCQWSNRTAIDFFTGGGYNLTELRNFNIRELIKEDMPSRIIRNGICAEINQSSAETLGKPLFLWTRWQDEKFLHGIFEKNLLEQINDNRIEYIIITLRRNFLSLYFQDNPNVTLAKFFSNGQIKIYKVNARPVTLRNAFGAKFGEGIYKVGIYKYFHDLYDKDISEYRTQRKNIKTILGWSDDKAEEFFLFFEEARKTEFYDHYHDILVYEDEVY